MRSAPWRDDAHVIGREEDVRREVGLFVRLLNDVYKELGFDSYEVALATRPAERAGANLSERQRPT
jgi:threonyl-tRNA synthetase